MKNIAVIFAGGTGTRMNSKTVPKQFLELHGKPIIIHTIEKFETHKEIDGIVVVCLSEWIDYLRELLIKFSIKKVVSVVAGGETGQLSIYNGLKAAKEYAMNDAVVLIHDGVRPLVTHQVITDNIESVQKFNSAITTKPVIETVIQVDENNVIKNVVDRASCKTAVAPQSFILSDILEMHEKSIKEKIFDMIDSATMARYFGKELSIIEGGPENIKITTPSDFYLFRALVDSFENQQIFG